MEFLSLISKLDNTKNVINQRGYGWSDTILVGYYFMTNVWQCQTYEMMEQYRFGTTKHQNDTIMQQRSVWYHQTPRQYPIPKKTFP